MRYIVDIDNTICKTNGSDYQNSVPMYDRINIINQLYEMGHEIVYWTARGGQSRINWSQLTELQLKTWGCLYHELRMNKPSYDVWIDDKAMSDREFFGDFTYRM
jgi:hypothetical protein